MQPDLIKEIVSGIIGKDGEKIVEILYRKKLQTMKKSPTANL